MFDMRLRLREIMANHKPPVTSAYKLAQISNGTINTTTAQRLLSEKKPPKGIDFSTLDAICDTLGCKPSQLLERD